MAELSKTTFDCLSVTLFEIIFDRLRMVFVPIFYDRLSCLTVGYGMNDMPNYRLFNMPDVICSVY